MLTIPKQIILFYVENLRSICLIVVPVALPLIIIDNFVLPQFISAENFTESYAATIFISWIGFPIYTGALIIHFSSKIRNISTSIKNYFLLSLSFWPKLFFVAVITNVLIGAGLMVLVVPGIYLFVRFSLAEFFVVLEGISPIESIKKSYIETNQHQLLIVGCIFLFFIPLTALKVLYPQLVMRFPDNEIVKIFFELILYVLGTITTVVFFRIYCIINNKNQKEPDIYQAPV